VIKNGTRGGPTHRYAKGEARTKGTKRTRRRGGEGKAKTGWADIVKDNIYSRKKSRGRETLNYEKARTGKRKKKGKKN